MKSFLSPRSLYWLSLIVFAVMFLVLTLGAIIFSGFNQWGMLIIAIYIMKYVIPISLAIMACSLFSLIVSKIVNRKKGTQEYPESETDKNFVPSEKLRTAVLVIVMIGAIPAVLIIASLATSLIIDI